LRRAERFRESMIRWLQTVDKLSEPRRVHDENIGQKDCGYWQKKEDRVQYQNAERQGNPFCQIHDGLSL
jgi:hypothetical protein